MNRAERFDRAKLMFDSAVKFRNRPLALWALRIMHNLNEDMEDALVDAQVPRGIAEIEQFLRDVSDDE